MTKGLTDGQSGCCWKKESGGRTGWLSYICYNRKYQQLELLPVHSFDFLNKDAKKLLVSGLVFKDLRVGSWAAWSISVGCGVERWIMGQQFWLPSVRVLVVRALLLKPSHWALADVQGAGLV